MNFVIQKTVSTCTAVQRPGSIYHLENLDLCIEACTGWQSVYEQSLWLPGMEGGAAEQNCCAIASSPLPNEMCVTGSDGEAIIQCDYVPPKIMTVLSK